MRLSEWKDTRAGTGKLIRMTMERRSTAGRGDAYLSAVLEALHIRARQLRVVLMARRRKCDAFAKKVQTVRQQVPLQLMPFMA